MLREAVRRLGPGAPRVLDFGCGDGRGLDVVRAASGSARYSGVDIEASPEVESRIRADGDFRTYDGRDLPYEDASFDIVYSRQVFEHVRHPDHAAREIARVLRPGGLFVGSLSNLEPYHSFSIFNYTPYGVFRLLEDNGFTLHAMRPGVEGMGLIVRQLTKRRIGGFRLAYPLFGLAGKVAGWDARRQNYLRLRFSGHISFLAERMDRVGS